MKREFWIMNFLPTNYITKFIIGNFWICETEQKKVETCLDKK
jgi:hypothetical protein